jgi:hypothetical protein
VSQKRLALAGICGWLLLAFPSQAIWAQSPYEGYPVEPAGSDPECYPPEGYSSGSGVGYGMEGPPTGMDRIRQYYHPGPEWAASHGYPNYDWPNRHFDIWFRSQSFGATKRERCAIPDPWKPRGYGNLFARPNTSHRMDYNRPVLVCPNSEYGPSYYLREPDHECCCRTCQGHMYAHRQLAKERKLDRAIHGIPEE